MLQTVSDNIMIQGVRPQDSIHRKLLYSGPITNINYFIIYSSTNYYLLALKTIPYYNFIKAEVFILRAFTEFVIRILEQSIITEYKPVINSSTVVLFTYNN